MKLTKTALLLFWVALALAGGIAAARGQSALDGFDPNANGTIRALVVQADGKILIGGDFTTLTPNGGAAVTRNHIARLNPDGTLDATFNPNANGVVYAIAVQADGKILVGGVFNGGNSIGGQTRNFLARVDGTTGAADSFNPNPNSDVLCLAVQGDGKILAGGDFSGANSIGGATRHNMARLDPTTGLADSLDPNADSTVYTIVVQANGQILAGGNFNNIGGQTRHHIARLNTTTGLADSFAPNANGIVYAIALQADNKIVVGGNFFGASIGGQTRNYIARLDATTGLADSFNPNANGQVNAVAVQADGKILAGGLFNGANSIGSQTRGRLARLDPTTGLADSFDSEANGPVLVIAVQADGKALAGGQFTSLAPSGGAAVTRNHMARLETDGRLDQTLGDIGLSFDAAFGPRPDALNARPVEAIAVQADGKILIGGGFSSVFGVPRNNIARLNTDGTLDTTFNPSASDLVESIAVQPDGKILVGGYFNGANSIGGQMRNYIARLDPTTGMADSFNPNANNFVNAIVVQTDGKILAGGYFSGANSIGGQARNCIARLDPTTGMADSFNPNATAAVLAIAVQADGKVLAGGNFNGANSIGGQTRNYIARLDSTTGLADSFNPNPNADVDAIVVQPDGKILVGGDFNGASTIGGQTRYRLARLDPTGMADSFNPSVSGSVLAIALQSDGKVLAGGSFNEVNQSADFQPRSARAKTNGSIAPTRNGIARFDGTTGLADSFNPNAETTVYAVTLQADGKVLVGGSFSGPNSIGGQTRSLLARLSNDTAALPNLSVTQTSVTWTRGGSSPQFARVTFEYSTDNSSYTALGNGTAGGSTWALTGLNLPILQNFYIRARGYSESGFESASGSIVESVRNAYLLPVLKIVSITRPGIGPSTLQCLGIPNQVNDLQVSPDLSPGSFMTISPAPPAADGTGAFSYNDAGAVRLTKRFYRLAYP